MTRPKWIEDTLAFASKFGYRVFSDRYGLIYNANNKPAAACNEHPDITAHFLVSNYLDRHPEICGEYFAAEGGNYYEVLRLAEAENNARFHSTYDTIIIHHTSETREGEK